MRVAILGALLLIGAAPADTFTAADYQADAQALAGIIRDNYAYLDDLPGGVVPSSPQLDAERDAVHDSDSLLRYAEDMITALADHHALTSKSFKDDWAIVPSYSDLWIEKKDDAYVVTATRTGGDARLAGITEGYVLLRVGDEPIDKAVTEFWGRIGLKPVDERAAYAARVLAAGRRDRPRTLTFRPWRADMAPVTVTLRSRYGPYTTPPALSTGTSNGAAWIHFNNSIGDLDTIKAFDAAMAKVPDTMPLVIDLTDTPSGGTTAIARAIMGWFVTKPMPYQMHQWPAEERETGIVRQWMEYVVPRAGKYHSGPVSVRVGRWTGSMGEGLAVGFQALGKPVCSDDGGMAQLKGGVYDFALPKTGLVVKFPAERIYTVAGAPREKARFGRCSGGLD